MIYSTTVNSDNLRREYSIPVRCSLITPFQSGILLLNKLPKPRIIKTLAFYIVKNELKIYFLNDECILLLQR